MSTKGKQLWGVWVTSSGDRDPSDGWLHDSGLRQPWKDTEQRAKNYASKLNDLPWRKRFCHEARPYTPIVNVLGDLVPELQKLFDAYLKAQSDGDRNTFAAWVDDAIQGLTHSISCECDCHANNAVWPGAHCKNCGGTCEPGEG